jgi:hypothetical protein
MSDANPPASPTSRDPRSGSTRRTVLSMIPAAMLATWQGFGFRSKASSGPAAGTPVQMQIGPEGYSYAAAEIAAGEMPEAAASDCYTTWTSEVIYDEHGCAIEQHTRAADGSVIEHLRAGGQPEA